MADAFLPNPAMNVGFTADVSPEMAGAFAASFTAPGSALPLDEFTADVLRTDGAARAALFASVGEGRFTDELAIVAALGRPLAILQGEGEQLVNQGYLEQLSIPSLWRGSVQLIPGAGHAAHQEATATFTKLLDEFLADLD
jgi:pimeloyl-ACP methyl ester carboxylesterase